LYTIEVKNPMILILIVLLAQTLWAQPQSKSKTSTKKSVKSADLIEIYPTGRLVFRPNEWKLQRGDVFFTVDSKNKVRGVVEVTRVRTNVSEGRVLKGKVKLSHRLVRVKSEKIIRRFKKKKSVIGSRKSTVNNKSNPEFIKGQDPLDDDRRAAQPIDLREESRSGGQPAPLKIRKTWQHGVGVLVGLNFAKFGGESDVADGAQYTQGLNGGLGYSLRQKSFIADFILSYNQQGSKREEDFGTIVTSIDYLMISGDLTYRFPIATRGALALKLGLGYALAQSAKAEFDTTFLKGTIDTPSDDLDRLTDLQYRFGLAYEFTPGLGGNQYYLEVQYFFGGDLDSSDGSYQFNNEGLSALVGARFF
jgi:hypothetical protein